MKYLKTILHTTLVGTALFSAHLALADDTELETIEVYGQSIGNQTYDVTGLGSLNKQSGKLQREQVENIRDLTRYDPNIAINEAGGRGTTRGFSMRGVEKERVAVSEDGFASAPILRRDDSIGSSGQSRSSASINEVEYENLKSVSIRSGSSSTESGSGALGGSVSMQTKDTSDFFVGSNKNIATRLKMGYTSKDQRKLVSVAIAARKGKFEGFAQYTFRHGHEIKSHRSFYDGKVFIKSHADKSLPDGGRYLNASETSGPTRVVPNPLNYLSNSFLAKAGVHFNANHYLGAVVETTHQNYHMRDMMIANYYDGQKPAFFENTPTDRQIKFTPTRFYTDQHNKTRIGLEYHYTPKDNAFLDNALINLDYRHLSIATDVKTLSCAKWPDVDPNCWPNDNNPPEEQWGKRAKRTYSVLTENDIRLQGQATKSTQIKSTHHEFQAKAGIMLSNYVIRDESDFLYVDSENKKLSISRQDPKDIHRETPVIHSKNVFLSFSDRMKLHRRLDASIGLRYDYTQFDAHPTEEQKLYGNLFTHSNYHNFAWDLGAQYQPFDNWFLSYRASTGFRVPSVVDQLGPNFNLRTQIKGDEQGALRAEKSFNQEFGLTFRNSAFKLSASYFISHYYDIIDYVQDKNLNYSYFNAHNFSTHGFDIRANIDANALWDKLPEGLEFYANMGLTKIKGVQDDLDNFTLYSGYTFDAIQPFRFIAGVSYNDPEDTWGINATMTYSQGKDSAELLRVSKQGGLVQKGARTALFRTPYWSTLDITGHYKFNPHVTLRGGIYNIGNIKYITWESARQVNLGTEARVNTKNYTTLVAPGINFLINLEMKY